MSNQELIRKAARGRDVRLVGCFASNRSGEKLEEIGEPVLLGIEQFLANEFSSAKASIEEIQQHWTGIATVFHVYFKLAVRSVEVDPAAFLLSLSGWLREEAMRVVFVIWGPSMGLQSGLIPERLKWAVERLARAGSEKERDFAKRLIQFQRKLKKNRVRVPLARK